MLPFLVVGSVNGKEIQLEVDKQLSGVRMFYTWAILLMVSLDMREAFMPLCQRE